MDPANFEPMAMPLFDQLYNFAHWLTGNGVDADDLVQETYARALRGFGSFEAGTNLRAWMYRILRNTFLTSRSGLAAQKTMNLDDDDAGAVQEWTVHAVTPERLMLQQENRQLMLDALESLSAGDREILLLCEVEEMSYREIAQVLAVPAGTVMSRLSRARTRLRQALSATAPGKAV
ncbi:MAG TPA: sigma-70 family RNA polymerase sigma factor [Acidobacteriaceae bacterium]|jgi:RNA polymerase sigma-70 factor (ECF subfamily)|nr:sigma-70 family RNA polymerase sigma factor [Acidobacteriaceae bacterium]